MAQRKTKAGGARAHAEGRAEGTHAGKNRREGPQDAPGTPRARRATPKVALRCSPAWAAWLEGAAAHCDLSVSDLLAQAATRWAERVGFHKKAPRRVRGQVDHLGDAAQRYLLEHDQ
jgi:hypothetical protein